MTLSPARAAADLAALLPIDDPLAQVARLRLDATIRTEQRSQTMPDQPPVDPRDLSPTYEQRAAEPGRIGSPARDGAVDPLPKDYRGPTNAGEPGQLGNPHGPSVVAPGLEDIQ